MNADDYFDDLRAELDQIRSTLRVLDVEVLSADSGTVRRTAQLKSLAYIWISASLEQNMQLVATKLVKEINSRNIKHSSLYPGIHSIVFDNNFKSLQDVRGMKNWSKRIEILTGVRNTETVSISEDTIPTDGRTIRPDHFELLWGVFGFDRKYLPTPKERLVLIDLADSRNEIAHGHVSPISFGRRKTAQDVLKLVESVDDVAINFQLAIEEYFSKNAYLE